MKHLVVILVLTMASAATASDRPNFVVVMIDDMGWADVGYQGASLMETPNIDAFAAESMVFSSGYAPAPLCSATRASVITGKAPARLRLTSAITKNSALRDPKDRKNERPWWRVNQAGSNDHLPLEEVTLAERMQEAGYATGFFGKWHLTLPKYKRIYDADKQGFDVNLGGSHYPGPPSYFAPFGIIPGLFATQPRGEHIADRLTSEALAFMADHRDEPFFVCLWHYSVHAPWQDSKKLIAEYEKKRRPGDLQRNATYAAMVHRVDTAMRDLLDGLEKLGLDDNTVVIFTSDNGGVIQMPGGGRNSNGQHITSNAPLRGGKAMIYEGGIREPFVIRWPGVTQAGMKSDVAVTGTDIAPTVMAIAGIDAGDVVLDGESLVPLMKGGALEREFIAFHFPHYITGYRPWLNRETFWNTPSSAIRMGDWKLIRFYEGSLELYNLKDDIGERSNLAGEHPERVAEMEIKLDAWLDGVDAWVPVPNPAFRPNHERSKSWPLVTTEITRESKIWH